MKAVLLIILLLASFTAGWFLFQPRSCGAACDNQISTVDVTKFNQLISDKKAVIIDVRTPEEFAAGHLENAANADFYDSAGFSRYLDSLDKNNSYLLYCRSGNRSRQARMLMAAKGFTRVSDLDGGISAWQTANLPLIK